MLLAVSRAITTPLVKPLAVASMISDLLPVMKNAEGPNWVLPAEISLLNVVRRIVAPSSAAANTIVSLTLAAVICARSEPTPLSALFVTVKVVAARTTSTAPTSHAAPWGRVMPRWSVGCEHGAAPAALIKALPDCGMITSIIPPVSVAGSVPSDNVPLTALLAVKPVATPTAL